MTTFQSRHSSCAVASMMLSARLQNWQRANDGSYRRISFANTEGVERRSSIYLRPHN
jgi:hypothetical protein